MNVDKYFTLMVQKFKRFMKHDKKQKFLNKNEGRYLFVPTSYKCGNKGHIEPNFPQNKNQKKHLKNIKEKQKRYS